MSPSLKYAALGVSSVAVILLGLRPILDPVQWSGILIAAVIAVPVQVVAFAALNRYRGALTGFLAAWVGGTLVRMLVVGVTAAVVIRSGMDGAVSMLIALAGFFFGLLLLEPICFRGEPSETG